MRIESVITNHSLYIDPLFKYKFYEKEKNINTLILLVVLSQCGDIRYTLVFKIMSMSFEIISYFFISSSCCYVSKLSTMIKYYF